MRPDGRQPNEIRPITIEPDYIRYPEGSVLWRAGDTVVLCNVSLSDKTAPFLRGSGEGWVTAEYAMLPRATDTRSDREVKKGKPSGRSQEIQRLIGRALRAAVRRDLMGERSLTALAILFAVFKVKPSPFCILDEVDAALDETNVERFLRVLGDFVGPSQFCIVTHHKRTMAECQVLYGITMQKRGVSTRIAVAFDQVDEFSEGPQFKRAERQRIAGEEHVGRVDQYCPDLRTKLNHPHPDHRT